MAGAPRVNFLLNNGQSATSTTISGTIPAGAVAGDVVLVQFGNNSNTVTVSAAPAGWTLLGGPNDNTVGNAWLYGKELAAGEPGTGITWTFSATTRSTGQGAVYSGVSWAARMVGTAVTNTAATSSILIPTVASVPSGALFHVGFVRIRGIPASDVAPPVGYSQGASERAATAYGTGSDVFVEAAYKVAASAGSYGGETATAPATSRGTTYAVALPATSPPAGTASGTTTTSGAATGKRAPKAAAAGTVTTIGSAAGKRTPKATATGSVATSGAAVGRRTPKASASGIVATSGSAAGLTARSGTAAGTVTTTGAASGSTTRSGTATGGAATTGSAAGKRNPVATATGTVTTAGSAVGQAPAVGVADGTATGTTTVVGTAVGARHPVATATGTTAVSGSATGQAPAVGGASGTATGSVTVVGTATGRRSPIGTATGGVTVVGAAVGTQPSALRDITLTVGPGSSRTLTAAGRARALVVICGGSRRLEAVPVSRRLAVAGRSRTLTVTPED